MIHSFDTLLLEYEYLYIHGHGVQTILSFYMIHPFRTNRQDPSKLTPHPKVKTLCGTNSPLTSP